MHESKIARLNREVKYTRVLLDIITEAGLGSVLYYSAAGRTVKVLGNVASIMITVEPRGTGMARIHVQLGTSQPVQYDVRDTQVSVKLWDLINAIHDEEN